MKTSRRVLPILAAVLLVAIVICPLTAGAAPAGNGQIGINVLLKTNVSDTVLSDLGRYGTILDAIPELNAVTMRTRVSQLPVIQALPYVASASPDDERSGIPVAALAVNDFSNGLSTWDLDAINVTDFGVPRVVSYDGSGIYVAVLDTGLLHTWRAYFPTGRIATQFARCFGGGGGEVGFVSSQPNKWEEDTNSHGTHVTSTILGYSYGTTAINGVAPKATVIPVKVLNQNGSGWSSVVARGIVYVADLKKDGQLGSNPVVINMSLGGSSLDPLEKAAVDYAVSQGVIIVAAAGNTGTRGMHYPGAYDPVISVAASGWTGEWTMGGWWRADVPDPTNPADFYITDFSSRAKAGQDLDVAAPGSWVVGPYQTNNGQQLSYYYLGGTSMATPHVAGIVALMAQKDAALTASQAEAILENTAIPLAPGCRNVTDPSGVTNICWGADATGAGLVDAQAALAALP